MTMIIMIVVYNADKVDGDDDDDYKMIVMIFKIKISESYLYFI